MKKVTKVAFYIGCAVLVVLACGGVCKNLNLNVYFDWFETVLCFLSAILLRIIPEIFFND